MPYFFRTLQMQLLSEHHIKKQKAYYQLWS